MPHRRSNDKTTAPEPHTGIQGEGGFGCRQGEKTLAELAQQFDIHPTQITSGRRSFSTGQPGCLAWTAQRQSRTGSGSDGAACQDRRADAGERLFGRRARQGGFAERKAMIDRSHDLPITKTGQDAERQPGQRLLPAKAVSAADLALMRRMDELHLGFPVRGQPHAAWTWSVSPAARGWMGASNCPDVFSSGRCGD